MTLTQCSDVVSLGAMWASMVIRGKETEIPEKLFYEPNAYFADYGRAPGLCLNCYCLSAFWTKNDEILCWDVHFTQAGTYAATLAHATSYNPEGEEVIPSTTFDLSVGNTTNAVDMKNEAGRYWLSKTKAGNARIARNAGTFNIPAPGTYRVLLARTNDGPNTAIDKIEFIKK